MATGFPIIFGKAAVAAWTPAQISTALWLDAADAGTIVLNGSTVSQWNDKSGNGRDAVQATASRQPILSTFNGRPCIEIVRSGLSGDVMSFSSQPILDNSNFTFVAVIPGSAISRGSDQFGGWSIQFDAAGANVVFTVPTVAQVSSTTVGQLKTFIVLQGSYVTSRGNGGNFAQTNTTRSNLRSSSLGLQIGSSNRISVPGKIAEIVLCTRVLTALEYTSLEGYLAWKWGLQADLPVGHPYKTAPPTV